MLETAITIAIEVLFALVFVASLVDYLRRRDPLSRDLVAVFGSVAALFVVQFVGIIFGSTPPSLAAASAALILAQPLFTLRLAARLRPIPRAVVISAFVGYLVTAIPLVILPRPIPIAITLGAIGVFAITEFLAAGYLAAEARRRTGAARFRLGLAAAATALFAAALLTIGAGAAGGGDAGTAVGRVIALLAAIGYAVAFLPPGPLRRVWQGMAAYRYGLALVGAGGGSVDGGGTGAIWGRFAESAREIAGAKAAAIVGLNGSDSHLWAAVGFDTDDADGSWPPELFEALLSDAGEVTELPIGATSPIARDLGARVGARLISVVAMPADRAALVLMSHHHSLFGLEDQALIRLLAAQAVALAEREQLFAEQSRLAEQLFAASQAKSDFIASMSHELRTPLSAILGFSELMRAEPGEGDSRLVPDEWIEHIHSGGQHLLSLINDVLDLAKVEAGRLELDPAPFNLRDLVAETIAGLRPLADRKHLAITSQVDVGRFVADRGRVRQILYNLLSNAIKFTPDAGSISIEATSERGTVRLAVADTGPGISPEDQAVIFDEFRQVGAIGGRAEGTGLGLALARRLVEAHDGQIELTSELGSGSRFTTIFPQGDHPAAADEVQSLERGPEPSTGARSVRDVLVIEDDPSALRLLRTYLEADGYGVRVARDGPSGLAEARARPPAAIVLDILLPGADGWEVLREFKADPALRDLPVIIVTVVDERELGLALGAVDYFLKPVDRAALLSRLARYAFTRKDPSGDVRILAVDDDPAALDLIEGALSPEGFAVVRASGGREGIELATAGQFDLVVCDLIMPDLDGFDVVTALQADPSTREVPILILTAHTLSEADKVRLNGQILGIVDKGDDAATGLHRWLARLAPPAAATTPDPG
jgi:signal transduction histidine kinase/CheY-like chemotaxis protein